MAQYKNDWLELTEKLVDALSKDISVDIGPISGTGFGAYLATAVAILAIMRIPRSVELSDVKKKVGYVRRIVFLFFGGKK